MIEQTYTDNIKLITKVIQTHNSPTNSTTTVQTIQKAVQQSQTMIRPTNSNSGKRNTKQ